LPKSYKLDIHAGKQTNTQTSKGTPLGTPTCTSTYSLNNDVCGIILYLSIYFPLSCDYWKVALHAYFLDQHLLLRLKNYVGNEN